MANQETSKVSFEKLKASGKRQTLKRIVYVAVSVPSTAGEAYKAISEEFDIQQHSVTPRFKELENDGWISTDGERICKVTGELCVVWKQGGTKRVKTHRYQSASNYLHSIGEYQAAELLLKVR